MPDRTQQPPFSLPETISLPAAQHTLAAGRVPLWTIRAGDQELLRLTLVFEAGSRHAVKPFVASALINLLSEGTARHTAAEVAEFFDFHGVYYDTSLDRDYALITVSCLSRFLGTTLGMLEEILLTPQLSPDELSIYAAKRKQELIIEREKPAVRARELFAQTLFGAEHPYGRVSLPESYDTLATEDLRSFYEKFYVRGNGAFAVASGLIGDPERHTIEDFLERISNRYPVAGSTGGEPHNALARPTPQTGAPVTEHRPDALQSSLRLGRLLFPKGHPDFNGMQILSTVLGGYFGSRLVRNLREEKGFTYGIYAAMVNFQQAGYLAIASDVAAGVRDAAIAEIFRETELLRAAPIAAEELDMVRNIIAGEAMRIIDGPFGVADVAIESIQCGDPSLSNFAQFLDEVRTITPERLHALAQQYLRREDFVVVAVG